MVGREAASSQGQPAKYAARKSKMSWTVMSLEALKSASGLASKYVDRVQFCELHNPV